MTDAETTTQQEREIQSLNDRFGVASWYVQDDGTVLVELDDGDEFVIRRDGSSIVL